MKRLKTKTFLATVVAAALIVAIPASASAAEWLKNGSPLKENATVQLSGIISRSTVASMPTPEWAFSCEFHATVLLKPGEKGEMTNFTFDLKKCSRPFRLPECSVTSSWTPTNPTAVRIGGEPSKRNIEINTGFWWNFTGNECGIITEGPDKGKWLFGGWLVLQPNNAAAVSSATIFGEVKEDARNWYGTTSFSPAGVFGMK